VLRRRLEIALAVIPLLTAAVTLYWPRWIESVVGLEPDAGAGETEWQLVLLLIVLALAAKLRPLSRLPPVHPSQRW
jgi:hypothetical protein